MRSNRHKPQNPPIVYVDPQNGYLSGPGTKEKPFMSLSKAFRTLFPQNERGRSITTNTVKSPNT